MGWSDFLPFSRPTAQKGFEDQARKLALPGKRDPIKVLTDQDAIKVPPGFDPIELGNGFFSSASILNQDQPATPIAQVSLEKSGGETDRASPPLPELATPTPRVS